MESRDFKGVLLLVWRVCDQAFGRYRPLKGAEKWSHDHHENWKVAYRHTRKKLTDSKTAILFDLWRKITILRKNRSRTVASPDACGRLAVLNWRSSSIHASSDYYVWRCCAAPVSVVRACSWRWVSSWSGWGTRASSTCSRRSRCCSLSDRPWSRLRCVLYVRPARSLLCLLSNHNGPPSQKEPASQKFCCCSSLRCALAAAQCIVIGPVCMCVFGSVTMITRNCVLRYSPNSVCR